MFTVLGTTPSRPSLLDPTGEYNTGHIGLSNIKS